MPLTLSALNVYPVKGLKGIALTQARCTERGLEHDRRWMVVDAENYEFLSQREVPRMATVWTEIGKGNLTLSAPDMDPVDVPLVAPASSPRVGVSVWGTECDALAVSGEADAWLSDYLSIECRLVYMPDKSRRTSNPATCASPSVGRRSVLRTLTSVVLPAPLGPSRPKSSPFCTVRSTPVRAATSNAPWTAY